MRTRLFRLTGVTFIALSAACGVHQAETPAISGPSTLATSVSVTATPDHITQDGSSQSSVVVTVHGPNGQPAVGTSIRLDMIVGGALQDYGSLSARTVVTGNDGTAKSIYTAPAAPPPPASGTSSAVQIQATVLGSDATTTTPVTAAIVLVPAGVILPPADTPTPSFVFNPSSPTTGAPTLFDASASCPGAATNGVCAVTSSTISSYSWAFGDGAIGTGQTTTHTYATAATFNVTLTVTNSRGVAASVSKSVTLAALGTPTAAFVFSPSAPSVGQTVVFNATQSTAAPGHNIVSFAWIFGDGSTGTGTLASHAFSNAGTYNVTLTATDDAGGKTTSSQSVAVTPSGSSGGGGATAASFIASPSAPVVGQVVFFNASASTAATGKTLTNYAWNFGDGASLSLAASSTSHTFATPGTFTVSLTVTDSAATTATTTNNVVVTAAGAAAPTATFTFSPAAPGVGDTVFFNAATSVPGAGHTIVSYNWTFGDGGTGTGVNATHVYTTAGSYNVQLKTTDEIGQSTTSVATAISVGSPPSPTANFTFSPSAPGRGDEVIFDASSSTTAQGQTITDVAWNFGDGTAVIHCPGDPSCVNVGVTNRVSQHKFTIAQTFVVNLVVTDSAGRTGSHNTSVTVAVADPNVIVTASPSSPSVAAGGVVNFNSSQTTFYPGTPAVPAPTYAWSFGDGGTAATQNPSHAYTVVGTYTVTLSVTDGNNRTGVGTATVTVVP